ncbi:MAG: PorP/SprF family type IX secretion system membrane protein [Bacteroidota bacterium]
MPQKVTVPFTCAMPQCRRFAIVGLFWALLSTVVLAQDFHYSQFYNAPMHLNPALTGLFGGDARLTANYKSQWPSVPVEYNTFTVAYDRKFYSKRPRASIWSGGVALNYDRSGDSKLTWADIDLNASYTRYLSDRFYLTVGGQAGIVNRTFREDNLRFDNQFNQEIGAYDPSLGSGEVFAGEGRTFLDFAVGINLRFQTRNANALVDELNKRTKLDVGIALHHLTRPDQSFFDSDKVPIEQRVSPYAMLTLQVSKPVDIVANVTYQTQGPAYEELVGMAAVRFYLNRRPGRQWSFLAGAGLRRNVIQDAWWPTIEIGLNNLRVGINYDFNVSRFDIATENRGGWELSMRYLFRSARPLPGFRTCPLI